MGCHGDANDELCKRLVKTTRFHSRNRTLKYIFSPLDTAISRFQNTPSESNFNRLADLLQTFLVFHTKSQRINGSQALSLPPATTSTIMLTMPKEEDLTFNKIHSTRSTLSRHCSEDVRRFAAERSFLAPLSQMLRWWKPFHRTVWRRTSLQAHKSHQDCGSTKGPSWAQKDRAGTESCRVYTTPRCSRCLRPRSWAWWLWRLPIHWNNASEMPQSVTSKTNPPADLLFLLLLFVVEMLASLSRLHLVCTSLSLALIQPLKSRLQVSLYCYHLYEFNSELGLRVFFCDLPGRIHRLGQDKPCHVMKFESNL